jgi:hypothetical protein
MKRLVGALLIAVLLVGLVPPASAHGGHGFYGPIIFAPLWLPFAVAATIATGVAAVVTAPFIYPAAYAPAPVYAPPVAYAPPPTYTRTVYAAPAYVPPPAPPYAPPARALAPPAPQTTAPAPPYGATVTYAVARSAPATASYWYYCPDAGAYYPHVNACASGWVRVPPR